MKGYRTIIVNVIALVASVLAAAGYEMTPEEITTVSTGVLAVVNIALRFITDTPPLKSEPK